MSLVSSSKTLVLTLAATFVAAAGALAQPALKLEIKQDAAGTYKLFQSGKITIRVENTTRTSNAGGTPPPDNAAINRANTAYNVRVSKLLLVGSDIYRNRVTIANGDLGFGVPNGSNELAPEGNLEREVGFTIPNDGTLHNNDDPGYFVLVEVEYFLQNGSLGGRLTASTLPNVLVNVTPNLELPAMTHPTRMDHRGGEVVQFTATIRNTATSEGARQSRPLLSNGDDRYRLNTYLTTDPTIGNNDDFLLDFMDLSGDMGGTVIDSSSVIRQIRTVSTPGAIPAYGDNTSAATLAATQRIYTPQPDDGFLDIGEDMVLRYEILVPENFPGNYRVGGFVDALNNVEEPTVAENGARWRSARGWLESDQPTPSDNHFLNTLARFGIQATASPTLDLVSGQLDANTGLVSRAADDASDSPSVSNRGETVVFSSYATNLDTTGVIGNGRRHIYAKTTNPTTGAVTTRLISRSSAGVQANADCVDPVVSSDGRFVAFASTANNLVARDTGVLSDIFVHDLLLGTTTRVSLAANGVQANGASFRPSISGNGRFVAYHSRATNLLPAGSTPGNGTPQVFVADRDKDVDGVYDQPGATRTATYLASINKKGTRGNAMSYLGRISADGKVLAFVSHATNLDMPVESVTATGNGRYGTRGFSSIYRIDLQDGAPQAGTLDVVSVPDAAATTVANAASYEIAINENGKHIAFTSQATNLVGDDTNGVGDIFVRDYSDSARPKTVRVSRSANRSATGTVSIMGMQRLLNNVPQGNVLAGEVLTLSDGVSTNDFTVGGNWLAGANASISRDELVRAIRATALNIDARSTTPSIPITGFLNTATAFLPSIELYNTIPGAQGNQPMLTGSLGLLLEGMSGGGTQADDPVYDPSLPLEDYRANLNGSDSPSIDASGRFVAFRSIAVNLDVYKTDPFDTQWPPRHTLRPGERIRPLINGSDNIYVHDRQVDETQAMDDENNIAATRVSVNKFGYPTTGLLDQWSSAATLSPAISGNALRVVFAANPENNGSIIFGRNNRAPLDRNEVRDVFLYKRNDAVDTEQDLQAQSIAFEPIASPIRYGSPAVPLRARATSGLTVQLESSDTTVAQVAGTQLFIVGTGEVEVTARQAGNDDFQPATPVTQKLVVTKAPQKITYPKPTSVNSTSPVEFNLGASVDSGLPLAYVSSNPKIAAVSSAGVVRVPAGAQGTVTITVSQPGNSEYEAAAPISQQLQVVTSSASRLTFLIGGSPATATPLARQVGGTGQTLALSATTPNTNANTPVVFTSSNPSAVRIGPVTAGAIVGAQRTYTATATIVGAGSNVQLRASQAASTTHLAAPTIVQVINVSAGTPTALKALGPVSFGAPDIALEATDSFGRAITHRSTNTKVAEVVGGKLRIVGAGTVNIISSSVGDANRVGLSATRTLTVGQGTQTIAWNPPTHEPNGGLKHASAPRTTSAGVTITYTSDNPAAVSVRGNTLTRTGKGFANVTATAPATANHKAPKPVVYRIGAPL